jgi:hypothetical protein
MNETDEELAKLLDMSTLNFDDRWSFILKAIQVAEKLNYKIVVHVDEKSEYAWYLEVFHGPDKAAERTVPASDNLLDVKEVALIDAIRATKQGHA